MLPECLWSKAAARFPAGCYSKYARRSEVNKKELIRDLVEEHGLPNVFDALIHVCADKAIPTSSSELDKALASRWGKVATILSGIQIKLDSTVPL
jgi:hypothetical protein